MTTTDDTPVAEPDNTDLVPTDRCGVCHYPTAPIGQPCPDCGQLLRVHDQLLGTWNPNAPGSLAVVLAGLDMWTLDQATRGIEARLTEAIRVAANERRRARVEEIAGPGAPIDAVTFGETEIAPLARDLFDAASVLERLGKAFTAAAKAAKAEIGEEAAMIGVGAAPTAKRRSLRIPYGNAGKIVVMEKTDDTTVWDDGAVADVIASEVTVDARAAAEGPDGLPIDDPESGIDPAVRMRDYFAGYRDGAKAGILRAITLRGKTSWLTTQIKALREGLQRRGRDDTAGVLERALITEKVPTGEYDVKWESKR